MTDIVSPAKRSHMMAAIGSKNTRPEIIIRKALHYAGYRYSLHKKQLPGKPDLVFRKYNAVIFINGCFWHGHDCHLFKWPKTRPEFWRQKIEGNKRRDLANAAALEKLGWRQMIIWECAIKGKFRLEVQETVKKIEHWLKSDQQVGNIGGYIKIEH